MKAKVMIQTGDRRLEMAEHEVPKVGADEGLLRVEACGLCGSDVEQYKGRFTQKGIVRYPLIPGHEPIGIIHEIGAEASRNWGVKKGDRVALEPHLTCGTCHVCLGGRYHLCKALFPVATPAYGFLSTDFGHGLWGGYGEFIHLHRRTVMHKLPNSLPLSVATMYQAIAAGVRWSVHVPESSFSDTVLILGCGQRGLGAVFACANAGVRTIITTGLVRDRYKLQLARTLGAHYTIEVDREDTLTRVMEITGQKGVDVAVDVSPGTTQPINDAIKAVRVGGTVVLAGIKGGQSSVNIDSDYVVTREISLRGVYSQGNKAYEQALDLITRNVDRLKPMHTHEFPLEQAAMAIETLAGEREGEDAICVSIHPGA
jgi:threonine dehydrogenase-like Zn-dependent dehydrogenase